MRFLTERGQNVNGEPNIIYVSSNTGVSWTPLHDFVNVSALVEIELTVTTFDNDNNEHFTVHFTNKKHVN